jgi:hypothetical protein
VSRSSTSPSFNPAAPVRARTSRVEHRCEIVVRGIDDAEHLSCRDLLRSGFCQLHVKRINTRAHLRDGRMPSSLRLSLDPSSSRFASLCRLPRPGRAQAFVRAERG